MSYEIEKVELAQELANHAGNISVALIMSLKKKEGRWGNLIILFGSKMRSRLLAPATFT